MQTVQTIDCNYLGRSGFACAFLMIEGDRAAFVENNTAHALPLLLAALDRAGMTPAQVDYAFVTHAHLDHAGGSSALMEACPNATLVAHPRAARHLIDPSRLVASASQVYGEERFGELYGVIRPIAAERVKTMEDGETLRFGERTLRFFHTRGHANHHLVILDPATEGLFTGDAFGLAYPALQGKGTFALPSTSPTDYLADEALAVIDQLEAMKPARAYLTHFGEHADVAGIASQLRADLRFSRHLFDEARACALTGPTLEAYCREKLDGYYATRLEALGLPLDEARTFLALDLELNAQGLAYAATRARG